MNSELSLILVQCHVCDKKFFILEMRSVQAIQVVLQKCTSCKLAGNAKWASWLCGLWNDVHLLVSFQGWNVGFTSLGITCALKCSRQFPSCALNAFWLWIWTRACSPGSGSQPVFWLWLFWEVQHHLDYLVHYLDDNCLQHLEVQLISYSKYTNHVWGYTDLCKQSCSIYSTMGVCS